MYFNLVHERVSGNVYSGGSVCMGRTGRTLTSKKAYFAEGHVKRNMEEYLTVMNPSSRKASLKPTLTYGDGYSKVKKRQPSGQGR